jgi:hypothetical protein
LLYIALRLLYYTTVKALNLEKNKHLRRKRKMTRFEQLNHLIEELGTEETLNALVSAMSDDEMKANYDYICRMYDLRNQDEEEDEE